MFSMTTRWPSFWLSLSAMMREVTSATPPAPNGRTILIGFSGQAALAPLNGASISATAASIAQRRLALGIFLFICVSSTSLFLMIQNHKAVQGCLPAGVFEPEHRAQIAVPGRPDRPHRPHASHSDAGNR